MDLSGVRESRGISETVFGMATNARAWAAPVDAATWENPPPHSNYFRNEVGIFMRKLFYLR
jgi:hypothetical protein